MPALPFASAAIALFSAELQASSADYVCHSALPGARADVAFVGAFLGQQVRWNMQLATLAHLREAAQAAKAGAAQPFPCPFIEIAAGVEGVFALQVGLDLAQIDTPAIRKSIIMIRNYKRLALGRLEFCAATPAR